MKKKISLHQIANTTIRLNLLWLSLAISGILLLICLFTVIRPGRKPIPERYTQDIRAQDDESRYVLGQVKLFFQVMDRCDPFHCNDNLQVTSIERLSKTVVMLNTGGAMVEVIPYRVTENDVRIIESTNSLRDLSRKYKPERCEQGDYLVQITQWSANYRVLDRLKICYQVSRRNLE